MKKYIAITLVVIVLTIGLLIATSGGVEGVIRGIAGVTVGVRYDPSLPIPSPGFHVGGK